MTYAAQTNVSVEKSRADIERLLLSKGAGQLMLAFDQVKGAAVVGWTMEGRMVQVSVPQPDPKAAEFTKRMFKGRPTYKSLPADVA
jgi:hypothetical protein